MPIFDYYCEKCVKVFEVIVMGDIKATQHCPDCGEALERKMSPLTSHKPDRYDTPGWKR